MKVGVLRTAWRYPVVSMMGSQVPRVRIERPGVVGDRGYAMRWDRDGRKPEVASGKRFPTLMQFSARYPRQPQFADRTEVAANIFFPGQDRAVRTSNLAISTLLSEALERQVSLGPLRGYQEGAARDGEIRFTYETPAGPITKDAYPIHLVTTASLTAVKMLAPEAVIDVRRFRPNLVVETSAGVQGFVESAWKGKRVRIGEVLFEWIKWTDRCNMIERPLLPSIREEKGLLKTICQAREQNEVGIYLGVVEPGWVRAGDPVELLD